jgi:hypothetical protein
MTSFWEILKSSKSLKASDAFAELWGKSIAESWDIITITGTLPLTFEAKGEALTNYRLYGTSEGVGEKTENLFDGVFPEYALNGTRYKQIRVPGGDYTFWTNAPKSNNLALLFAMSGYAGTGASTSSDGIWDGSPRTVASKNGFITLAMHPYENYDPREYQVMITAGSTIPASYIPPGYKIPLTVTSRAQSQDYPLYIGDTQLMDEEYVDYGEQKVWKMVDGTLTPTDPPVPFPEITTFEGENTLTSTETVGEVSVTGKIKEI